MTRDECDAQKKDGEKCGKFNVNYRNTIFRYHMEDWSPYGVMYETNGFGYCGYSTNGPASVQTLEECFPIN